MERKTLDDILIRLNTEGMDYNNTVVNLIRDKSDRMSVLSEISIDWLERPEKVLRNYNNDSSKFEGYIVTTIRYQYYVGNTSPYYKKWAIQETPSVDNILIIDDSKELIDDKILFEERNRDVLIALTRIEAKHYEIEWFKKHLFDCLSYRNIRDLYGSMKFKGKLRKINHVRVGNTIKEVRIKLIAELIKMGTIINIKQEDENEIKRLITLSRITHSDYISIVQMIRTFIDYKYVDNSTCPQCVGKSKKRLSNWYNNVYLKNKRINND